MIELTDLTLLLPVRIDSQHRLENLDTIITFIKNNFIVNVIICENSKNPVLQNRYPGYTYIFIKNDNLLFHKTKTLNRMTYATNTKYCANYDIDIIIDPNAFYIALELLKNNTYNYIFPYDGTFLGISRNYIEHIRNNIFFKNTNIQCQMMNPMSDGGILMYNKKKFIEDGMENENFISYGFEDNERVIRFEKLGNIVYRLPGYKLFHLNHIRGLNSCSEMNPRIQLNIDEYNKIKNIEKEELKQYVNTWEWCKK